MSQGINNENQIRVVKKLNEVFTNDDDFDTLMHFLDRKGSNSVYMNTLTALLDNDRRFQMMAEGCLQQGRRSIAANINEGSHSNSATEENIPELPTVIIPDNQINHLHMYAETSIPVLNLAQGIRAIPAIRQAAIISEIMGTVNSVAGERSLIAVSASKSLTNAQKMAGKVAPIAIVAVQLSWEALKSISSWWKGEITGKRCAKQIIDASAGILGGYGGGAVDAAVGSALVPGYGTLAGALIGSIAGYIGTSALAECLTEYFFDLPKSIAVENAYNFLGLPPSCSNYYINRRYRTLALRYHPDKGGDGEDFHKLQISVAIIKQARGQGV